MWERLKKRVEDLKKRDTATTQAYFITQALSAFGHSKLLGGEEAAEYLHKMGLDDQTILKMQRKYYLNKHDTRESLENKIYESLTSN